MEKEKKVERNSRPCGAELSELSEGCIANIVSFTSPQDACRACAISPIFRAAAESNAVWERFLPSDYQAIIARSSSSSSFNYSSKKQFYLTLSDNPILIDDSKKKSFFLDKLSGKKCYLIIARDLSILWGDIPEFWTWVSLPESRFPEVARLNYVLWFEISVKMRTSILSPKTNYTAYLVFKWNSEADGDGYNPPPPVASVGIIGGEVQKQTVCLGPPVSIFMPLWPQDVMVPQQRSSFPKWRNDGWSEIKLGEFFNKGGGEDELEISLVEVEPGTMMSDLMVEGIEIRPKEVNRNICLISNKWH